MYITIATADLELSVERTMPKITINLIIVYLVVHTNHNPISRIINSLTAFKISLITSQHISQCITIACSE